MSTTTPSPRETKPEEGAVASTTGRGLQGWLLILVVFVRLLAPYFGSSLFVWANLIGLILLYLTVGYYVGGRLADRSPRPGVLYTLTIIAAFLISVIPFLSRPILLWSQSAFATYSIGVFYGSLVSVILLFAIPMILLGCVSPFAIRLRIEQVGKSGRTSGQLYAISTAGSIVGTFLPVLLLIPNIGTYRTFFTFAVALLLVSIAGLVGGSRGTGDHKGLVKIPRIFLAPHSSPPSPLREGSFPRKDGGLVGTRVDNGPRPRNGRVDKRLLSILLLIPMALSVLTMRGPIKAADGSNGGGVLITERESAYNYLQVVQVGGELQLIMNEGVGIHSVYNPHSILTQGYWDDFLVAPYFNNPPFTQDQVRKVALIGLGAGTAAREFTATYGPIPIDGVEIDGTVVELGRQYFHMTEPNLHVIVQDGRYYLQTTSQKYDVIGVDTYQQPYVPFQFTTQEFFQTVRDHLTPTGVVALNAGRTSNDYRLVEALAQTMHSVFPNVYIIDTERFTNSLVIGTNAPTSLANLQINANHLTSPLLQSVAQASIVYGKIREEHSRTVYFTDDRAPVEQLIDQIILDAVENQGK